MIVKKTYRKPYNPHREESPPENGAPSLKKLLKETGGSLSLVELLQQKNLSLTDLLKGKENAISALKETSAPTQVITERLDLEEKEVTPKPIRIYEMPQNENESYATKEKYYHNDKEEYPIKRRLPPARLPKPVPVENTNEEALFKEHINAQRKRLSNLRSDKDNRIFNDVKHVDVVTEATTEKRIFVPSKYKSTTEFDSQAHDSTPVYQRTSFRPTISSTVSSEENFIGTVQTSTSTLPPTTTVFVNQDIIIKGNIIRIF